MSTMSSETLRRRAERAAKWGAEKKYTVNEVAEHNRPYDSWIILGGSVYDVSGFDSHPGGSAILEQCAGKDVTDAFKVNHTDDVWGVVEKYYLGEVVDAKAPNALMKEFHELDARFKSDGLYETELSFYVKMGLWYASLFAVVLLPFVGAVEQTWAWMAVSSVALGLFWQQLAFLGHDLGHNAVFHDRLTGDYLGSLFVVLGFGVSGQWWKQNHNVHHIVTNSINGDPDIQYLPLFMVDSAMAKGFYSLYHKTRFAYDKAAQFLVGYQHILYLPVMALARHNLYLQSWIFVLTGKDVRRRYVEAAVLVLYAWWLAELVLRIEDSNMAWMWWFVSHSTCGILHVQITLSHFSMECFETQHGTIHRTAEDDFVRHQCATSLDVDCHPWMDWFHGGLHFQVVHHLWPRLPRHNLREIRDKYLVPLCKKHNVEYHQLPFFPAVGKTLTHMKAQAHFVCNAPPNPAHSPSLSLVHEANTMCNTGGCHEARRVHDCAGDEPGGIEASHKRSSPLIRQSTL